MTGTRERRHLPTIPDSCKQRRHFRKDLDPEREGLEAGAGGGDPYSAHSSQKEGALPSSFIQKKVFSKRSLAVVREEQTFGGVRSCRKWPEIPSSFPIQA